MGFSAHSIGARLGPPDRLTNRSHQQECQAKPTHLILFILRERRGVLGVADECDMEGKGRPEPEAMLRDDGRDT